MAASDRLSRSLQESLLCLICFDDTQGPMIATLVGPELFEEPYREVAARALEYRAKYGKAPGEGHIGDLFDTLLEDGSRRAESYRRILIGLRDLSGSLNAVYVANRTTEFIRRQTLKAAIIRAGTLYNNAGPSTPDEVEAILWGALRKTAPTYDPGVFLSDRGRGLEYLRHDAEIYKLGIPELDKRGLGPTRKELLLLIGPKKRGKSWWLIHVGKMCLRQRANVLHVTLENSEEITIQRYHRALFGVAKKDTSFEQTLLDFDELGRLSGFRRETNRPSISLQSPDIRKYLSTKIDEWGARLDGLCIKEFPTKSLTTQKLRAHLDMLETVHNFIPDVLILDYPDLMKIDMRNPRMSIGNTYEEIRGLCVERNMAGVVVTQANRKGGEATKVTEYHVAEDASKIATADTVLTYSQTEDENQLGLARLFCSNARNDEDRFTILITQAYQLGQFVLDSVLMPNKYWDHVKSSVGRLHDDPADENEEEDDQTNMLED